MLFILVISFFVHSCIAVNPSGSSREVVVGQQARSSTIVSPLTRWIELSRQIYNDIAGQSSDQINLPNLKLILAELSSLEKNELPKFGIDPKKGSKNYHIKHYGHLVSAAFASNLLDNSDATITDLLLQSFEHDSNECSKNILDQLNEMSDQFVHTSIAIALQENYQLQYENCISRSKQSLSTITRMLGTRQNNSLNELLRAINPSQDKLINLTKAKEGSFERSDESRQIGDKIGQYLSQQKTLKPSLAANIKLKHLVINPCKSFLNKASQIVANILQIIESNTSKKGLFDIDQTVILNKYLLCERIMSDESSISAIAEAFMMMVDENRSRKLKRFAISESFVDNQGRTLLQIDGSMQDPFEDLDQFECDSQNPGNLITQQMPFNLHDYQENIEGEQQEDPNPMLTATNNHKRKLQLGIYVTRIDKTAARGRDPTYLTHWSDGSASLETRTYLSAFWPERMIDLYRQIDSELKANQAKSKKPTGDTDTNLENISLLQEHLPHSDNANTKWVTYINRCVGKRRWARYPTQWSDGTTSLETKKYLQQHWPNEMDLTIRRFASEDYAGYLGRCKTKNLFPGNLTIRRKKRPRAHAPDIVEVDRANIRPKNSTVISIENITLTVESKIKYLTNWANGISTMEDEDYLSVHWPEAWTRFICMELGHDMASSTANNPPSDVIQPQIFDQNQLLTPSSLRPPPRGSFMELLQADSLENYHRLNMQPFNLDDRAHLNLNPRRASEVPNNPIELSDSDDFDSDNED